MSAYRRRLKDVNVNETFETHQISLFRNPWGKRQPLWMMFLRNGENQLSWLSHSWVRYPIMIVTSYLQNSPNFLPWYAVTNTSAFWVIVKVPGDHWRWYFRLRIYASQTRTLSSSHEFFRFEPQGTTSFKFRQNASFSTLIRAFWICEN